MIRYDCPAIFAVLIIIIIIIIIVKLKSLMTFVEAVTLCISINTVFSGEAIISKHSRGVFKLYTAYKIQRLYVC